MWRFFAFGCVVLFLSLTACQEKPVQNHPPEPLINNPCDLQDYIELDFGQAAPSLTSAQLGHYETEAIVNCHPPQRPVTICYSYQVDDAVLEEYNQRLLSWLTAVLTDPNNVLLDPDQQRSLFEQTQHQVRIFEGNDDQRLIIFNRYECFIGNRHPTGDFLFVLDKGVAWEIGRYAPIYSDARQDIEHVLWDEDRWVFLANPGYSYEVSSSGADAYLLHHIVNDGERWQAEVKYTFPFRLKDYPRLSLGQNGHQISAAFYSQGEPIPCLLTKDFKPDVIRVTGEQTVMYDRQAKQYETVTRFEQAEFEIINDAGELVELAPPNGWREKCAERK